MSVVKTSQNLEVVEEVLKEYVVPSKKHDGIKPREVAEKIIDALNGR
jgi:hypothetical protein